MEARERGKINLEATKHVAALGLAVEQSYGIDYAYAVDGSVDMAEPRGAGETGARAAAWGSWDGRVARGGALPPGTGNQEAELFAIERTLAQHARGDRVLIFCDCQSAMRMVDAAWRCGTLGVRGAMAGRVGGLLVEAITRHRLRMASESEDGRGRQGGVTFLWVKAHGGGVAPNAYADAIAKSHLAEPISAAEVDAPFEQLPRACVYAAAPSTVPGMWEPEGTQRFCVAADRSLRQLIVDGLTRKVLKEWRERATGKAASATV